MYDIDITGAMKIWICSRCCGAILMASILPSFEGFSFGTVATLFRTKRNSGGTGGPFTLGTAPHASIPPALLSHKRHRRRVGTFLTRFFPTRERVAQWVDNTSTARRPGQFNHACMGMTTPPVPNDDSLLRAVDRDDADDGLRQDWPGLDGNRIDSSWRVVRERVFADDNNALNNDCVYSCTFSLDFADPLGEG